MQVPSQLTNRALILGLMVLGGCVPCVAGSALPIASPLQVVHVYHRIIPLGSEVFSYRNGKQHNLFYIMASAQSPVFEGELLCTRAGRHLLTNPDGTPVERYPRELRFRVSVAQRDSLLFLDQPLPVESRDQSFNELITSVKFELHIFRALNKRVVRPSRVQSIGIPPDVPANERIYEVTFDLDDIPISDRVVMRVLSDQGERLAKFNFDLY